ncbi:hypothetical protein GCM10025783_16100 [Amnibacterium soli]|uniref:Uncharacterized protein n=1 Tax=Amnibacterium soli TaxID=1282736 RepID=A0ABP8Z367_9MICO
MTTTTTALEREADAALHAPHLPALAPTDRLALALGTQLILWGERQRQLRVARADRAEQARASQAAARADAASRDTFEHRAAAGPAW